MRQALRESVTFPLCCPRSLIRRSLISCYNNRWRCHLAEVRIHKTPTLPPKIFGGWVGGWLVVLEQPKQHRYRVPAPWPAVIVANVSTYYAATGGLFAADSYQIAARRDILETLRSRSALLYCIQQCRTAASRYKTTIILLGN